MNYFKQLHLVPFLFSLQFIFGYAAISNSCPVNWRRFGTLCYLKVDTAVTWTEANELCKRHDGQLAKIDSILLNEFLKNGKRSHWFGLHRCGGNKWCFPDWKIAGPFYHWDKVEPNNNGGNEDCGEMRLSGFWNDLPCSRKLPYICQKKDCPVNWRRFGTSCYLKVDTAVTWTEANDLCKRYGGQLANIETSMVNSFMLNQFLKNAKRTHWFGLHRCGGNKWCFPDWNIDRSFYNWDKVEPNNSGGNEGCVEIRRTGFWNDLPCSIKLPYICQKKD